MRGDVDVRVTKVYTEGRNPFFFVNGQRSDAYDELGVLEELLGDDFREVWIEERPESIPVVWRDLKACESVEQFDDLIEEYPDIVIDSR